MSIKPPEWFPNAIPTYDGWINPENKELLVRSPAGGFSEEVIKGYMEQFSNVPFKEVEEVPISLDNIDEIVEKTYVKSIDKMNKMQLKVYASEHGIEDIDDLTKKQIIAKIEEAGVA